MESIIDKIGSIEHLYHLKGCTEEQIQKAQEKLNLKFPKEFLDYVKTYGAISFYATEWMGLNVPEVLDVVSATEKERDMNPDFPKDCFVLENRGIDGVITVADQDGKGYNVQYEQKKLLCGSLSEYLNLCIARKSSKR